jgi:hypothetical protein
VRDETLLHELLEADTEESVLEALSKRELLNDRGRWRYLGDMPNNQSVVYAQQSTPAAALVEKYTNGVDAVLLRRCKALGIDPRGPDAPPSMARAIERFLSEMTDTFANANNNKTSRDQLRQFAEQNLMVYATGGKTRPSLSFYDAGEGQLPDNFPTTFCSLIHGSGGGSYKGAIAFVQGRFNMGGTGVLPFCSARYKLQLIVSRVPNDIATTVDHEWGYTIFCFFASKRDASWHYLVGPDGHILTAGYHPIGLLPQVGATAGTINAPRERKVACGTLIKMYDFAGPRNNICGELFKRTEEFLLRPPLPLRMAECRPEYAANVTRITVWDRIGAWAKDKLEPGFEDGASVSLKLETGETIPAEIRVFKAPKGKSKPTGQDEDQPQTGVRAIINGQSHARRDARFFRTNAVDKEHIAGSMLVLLDCTELGQYSRNALFMSNRETFREDPLLSDLFRKLQRELKEHDGLVELDSRRYEEKIADAVEDEDGIKALEELLASDPDLAQLFGGAKPGKMAEKPVNDGGAGGRVTAAPEPINGLDFPTYICRRDKSTTTNIVIPRGETTRVSFSTDVKNSYFTRRKYRGCWEFTGDLAPTMRLFNGRLTFTLDADKNATEGTPYTTAITVTDEKGSGPFVLTVNVVVGPPLEKKDQKASRAPLSVKCDAAAGRPDIKEVHNGPDAPPLTLEPVPGSDRLKLLLNVDSHFLEKAKAIRPKEEALAIEYVFKYGLVLTAMGLLDAAKKAATWQTSPSDCRAQILETATGVARVIVPLCLSLPKKLPKSR